MVRAHATALVMQTVRCNGFDQRRKRACTFVFGKTNGDFERHCPKCKQLMQHFHERVQVVAVRVK